MGDVVALKRASDPRVVRVLRTMLDMAERGEVVAVAVAAQNTGGETATGYEIGDGDIAHLVCSLERLKLRLLSIGSES